MDYVVCALPMEGLTDLEREVIQVKLELAQVKASLDEEKLAQIRAEEEKYRFLVKILLSRITHMKQICKISGCKRKAQ